MDPNNIILVNKTAQILLQSISELPHLVIVSPQTLASSSSSSASSSQEHYQCNENGTFTDIILSNSSAPIEKVLLKTQALAIPDLHVMIYAKVRLTQHRNTGISYRTIYLHYLYYSIAARR